MPRQYTKRSSYWIAKREAATAAKIPAEPHVPGERYEVTPVTDDLPHYTAVAACGGGDATSESYRNNPAATIRDTNRYQNIRSGILPFDNTRNGYYGMGEAIGLAMQAYHNVSSIRNAINMAVDFSVSDLHIKSVNKTVKRFISNWFDSIGLTGFMAQFFLEYYRSGNVFIYKFNGRIPEDKFNNLRTAFAAKSPELPIRYIILNPMQIYLQMGPSYNYTFSKMLSTYEIQRLRDPQTDEDRAVLKSFPKQIQDQIKNYSAQPYLYVPLDTKRLYYAFYRKQDYEPLAVPMVFPILNDVEWKLELKKLDQSIVRSMEQAVLHIATGAPADAHNPAIGKNSINTLQTIMQNQTVGRVLITDWTTKLEWKIPNLKELLGPEKYVRVDADIKEGLQYMFFGQEKFANASIKAKIFVESLREGRRAFLDEFLRPEVKKICAAMNFKNVPKLEFEEIDVSDQAAMNGLYFKMAQLGLLTNDELYTALETGILPDDDSSLENQEIYKKERKQGLYTPVVPPPAPGAGGAKPPGGGAGRPAGVKTPQGSNHKVGKIGTTSKASVDPESFDMERLMKVVPAMSTVKVAVEHALLKKHKLKELDDTQRFVSLAIAKAIVVNEPEDKWTKAVASYVKTPKDMDPEALDEIGTIAAQFDYQDWEAIALYKSRKNEAE